MKVFGPIISILMMANTSLFGVVTVVTKIRCELDFDYNSAVIPQKGLEDCFQKINMTDLTPNHVSIYASSSPPGSTDYNFALSKKRAEALSKKVESAYPNTDQEVFPGGENPNFGQKAVLIASISSSDQVLISRQKAESILNPDYLKVFVGRADLTIENGEYSVLGVEYQKDFFLDETLLAFAISYMKFSSAKYLDQSVLGLSGAMTLPVDQFILGVGPTVQVLFNHQSDLALDGGIKGFAAWRYNSWLGELSMIRTKETASVLMGASRII